MRRGRQEVRVFCQAADQKPVFVSAQCYLNQTFLHDLYSLTASVSIWFSPSLLHSPLSFFKSSACSLELLDMWLWRGLKVVIQIWINFTLTKEAMLIRGFVFLQPAKTNYFTLTFILKVLSISRVIIFYLSSYWLDESVFLLELINYHLFIC